MPIETIQFRETNYPILQSQGFAAQYAFPFAEKVCKGVGIDIGYSNPDWKFPTALYGVDHGKFSVGGIEKEMVNVDALNFHFEPSDRYVLDFVFSSHCLEHIPNWVEAIDYWGTHLKPGGVMFLYLPHCDFQEYWQPMFNRKHCNWLRPDMLQSYFNAGGWRNIFVTGHDLNYSFYAIAEKI